MGVVTYEILCEHCGTEFEARSTKRKYCSSKCRTAAHRYQNKPESNGFFEIDYHSMSDEELKFSYMYVTEQIAVAIGRWLHFWENQLVEVMRVMDARTDNS
jgi:hypothetical protein